MKKIKKRGFTLIELIVVLVILAIVALIVTPLVLNIIDKAKDSANKRSIDAYGKAIELAMQSYKLEHGKFTYDVNDLNIEYSGNKVECDEITLNKNGSVFITKCKIDGEYIEDEKTSDGYYQYGGVIFDYAIGDIVTYNNMKFYVMKNSKKTDSTVTLLKAEPLKTSEVDLSGTEIVTKVTESTNDYNDGYIHSAYLYSYTCTSSSLLSGIATGCTTDYKLSSIKQIVDSWVANKFETINLKFYEVGYSARLITYDEYVSLCESVEHQTPTNPYTSLDPVFDWMYNSNYSY